MQVDPKEYEQEALTFKQVDGGLLLQERDRKGMPVSADLKFVTKKKPTQAQVEAILCPLDLHQAREIELYRF